MAHTDIDKINRFVIRLLHSPDKSKKFGYLTLPVDYDGKQPGLVQRHSTLTGARNWLGAPPAATSKTKPKLAHPENQKGYRHG